MADGRQGMLAELARQVDVTARTLHHPCRVAVDGITASGKTTLADELAAALSAAPSVGPSVGRADVHRLSMDGYHHPRTHRHRRGRDSADGYYEDAYDFTAFAAEVLIPLGATDRDCTSDTYRPAIIDLATDRPASGERRVIAPDGVLVVDGSFLQRTELAPHWDVVVWVAVPFEVAEARGVARDADLLGGHDRAQELFRTRYHVAGRRYLEEVAAERGADVVVDNTDLAAPFLRTLT
jgi:uridine kinase